MIAHDIAKLLSTIDRTVGSVDLALHSVDGITFPVGFRHFDK
jgi:hypothetical protein